MWDDSNVHPAGSREGRGWTKVLAMLAGRRFVCALTLLLVLSLAHSTLALTPRAAGSPQDAQQPSSLIRMLGTVTAISGNAVTVKSDVGAESTFLVDDSTRMLRTAPGQTDLKTATPIHLADLQPGDRVLVRGKPSDGAKSIAALAIVVMKKSDIEGKQQSEREDWAKRGVGGIVSSVDPASGTITISSASMAGTKSIAIHISKDTIIRRYSPDSVKFDDAKIGTLDQIKPGDQVRARGTRSADGSEITAEEIVSGSFLNIAGLITAIDTAGSTLTVNDLKTKKPVVVKITASSQVRQLPEMFAQRIAMRFRGAAGSAAPGGAANGGAPPANASSAAGGGGSMGGGPGGGSRPGGTPDFQQILSRLPVASLSDLKKGDAVMIVTTPGAASGAVTAITLLSGVDAILAASPTGNQQAELLAPWNLTSPIGDAASQ
ncbi:MAG: DUF5666 domain-containing protein [Candidatus Acidiferrales bacterium]